MRFLRLKSDTAQRWTLKPTSSNHLGFKLSPRPKAALTVSEERYAPSSRVVLPPDADELVQVMRPENRSVTCQVLKVIHDDGDKQVQHLKKIRKRYRTNNEINDVARVIRTKQVYLRSTLNH